MGAAANRRLLHIVIEPQFEATLEHFIKIKVAPEVLAFLKVFPQPLSGEESARLQKHELYPRPASLGKSFECFRRTQKSRQAHKTERFDKNGKLFFDCAASEHHVAQFWIRSEDKTTITLANEPTAKTPEKSSGRTYIKGARGRLLLSERQRQKDLRLG